jgi:hypothetical protein
MLRPARIFRFLTEVVFVLLGALLVWLAITGRTEFNPRSVLWLAVSIVVLYRGLRSWLGAGRYVSRWQHRIRGSSLIVVGILMLAMVWTPAAYAKPLLATAGIVLSVRGLLGGVLAARVT